MAQKRMFSMKIVDSDAFLEMPLTAQCLYFHLNMRADDDGFIGNPKKIMRMIGARDDDFKLLIAKRFIILFEDSVVVIKHWWMHNTLAKDRYHETSYLDEKRQLKLKDNKSYTLGCEGVPLKNCEQNVNKMLTDCKQNVNADLGLNLDIDIDLGKDSNLAVNPSTPQKTKRTAVKHKYGEYQNVLLSDVEKEKLTESLGQEETDNVIRFFSEQKEMKGYTYKSDYLAIKNWGIKAYEERQKKQSNTCQNSNQQGIKDKFTGEEYRKWSDDPDKVAY